MKKSKKLPAIQFYVGDWMKAPEIRCLSFAAKGLCIDMLCLMFESQKRGHLEHPDGRPITPKELARMTGGNVREVNLLCEEMARAGTFSVSSLGALYSRRMVRDEEAKSKSTEYGKLGGNPELVKGRVNPPVKGMDNPPLGDRDKVKPTPSVSSSVSSSLTTTDITKTAGEETSSFKCPPEGNQQEQMRARIEAMAMAAVKTHV